jgi:TP901 family phage tail tape measure protein
LAAREEIVRFIYQVTGDKDLAATAATLLETGAAAEGASEDVQKFSDALQNASDRAVTAQKALDLQEKINANADALQKAKAGLEALNAEFSKADKSSTDLNVAFGQAQKAVSTLAAEQLKLQSAYAQTTTTLAKVGGDVNDLSGSLSKAKEDGAAAATSLGQLGVAGASAASGAKEAAAGTKALGEEANRSGNLLTLLADNLGKIVTVAAATKLALSGIHFASDSFEGAAKVEDQLERVRVTAQATQEQFEKFGPAIESAARAVNVSTDTAAQALAELAKQGQSADESIQSLVPTLQLAKIAQIDVAQAAGIVDDALDRFGLTAADAGTVVDILVAASKGAKDGLTGIANAMETIAPLAREAGLSFKDTAAILGLLQQNGFNAESAVKGLRTVFADLQNPASKLRENLFALGDSGNDFATAINTIAKSGDRGKKTLSDLDGSTRGLVSFLVQRGVGALDDFSAGLDHAAGSANRFVDTIKKESGESFTALTNAIDAAATDLAKPFLAPVSAELRKLADELNAFAQTSDFNEIKDELTGLANDAVKALDKLITGLDWKALAASAKEGTKGLAEDFHNLAHDADEVASAIGKVASVLAGLKNAGSGVLSGIEAEFGITTAAVTKSAAAISSAVGGPQGLTESLDRVGDRAIALTTDALPALGESVNKTAVNIGGLAGATAKVDFSNVIDQSGKASTAIDSLNTSAEKTPPILDEVAKSLSEALGASASKVHDDLVAASDAANAAHDAFRNLLQSGTATADALGAARDAALEADAKLAKLLDTVAGGAPKAISLADALKLLGSSQAELKTHADQSEAALNALYDAFLSGAGKIEDVRAEFVKWADDLRASVANSDQWQKDTVESTIRVKAALLGVTEQLGKLGDTKIPPPIDPVPIHENFERVGKDVELYKSGVEGISFANKEAADAFEELGGSAGSTGNLLGALQNDYAKFSAVSSAAVKKFSDTMKELFNGTGVFSVQALTDSTNIIKAGEAAAQASKIVQDQIDAQRQGVAALAQQYQDFGATATLATLGPARNLDALKASLEGDAAAAREGRSAFDLLGAADLSQLSSALDAAAAKVEQLKEEAKQAKDALADIGQTLADQIDELQGNQSDIENRRFKKQLQDIEDQAKLAGTLNSSEYAELVRQAKLLHELKLKQIKDEKDAQKKNKGGPDEPSPTNPPGGGGNGGGQGGGNAPAAPAAQVTINAVLLTGDQRAVDDFTRRIRKGLNDIDNRSR